MAEGPPHNLDIESEIKDIEQREARAMLKGDVDSLESMWADDLVVNSSANLIAGKAILLEVIRDGRLRLRSYSRTTMRLAINDETVVATGNEMSELDGIGSGTLLLCSYMNLWTKRSGVWRMFGRHVGLITRAPVSENL
jgi:uncharacterized protein DUF4440